MKRIGNLTLLRELGAGGTATVYLASAEDGREIAVKVLHPHLAADPVIRERFIREVKIARTLSHPAIVRVFDLIAWEDVIALSMEYCPGGNLHGWHAHDVDELIRVGTEIAIALGAAHEQGIIHRDLKPQNILKMNDSSIKLCDFGSARFQNMVGLTTTSMFIGTPQYVPPEVLEGFPPDPRTDLFALGAILYEAATGTSYSDAPLPSLLRKKGRIDFVRPGEINSALPEWLDDLICRMLGPIEKRPPTTYAFIDLVQTKQHLQSGKEKTCIHCREQFPVESPVCFSCGGHELVIERDYSSKSYALLLIKISEDVKTMESFLELLRIITGQEDIQLNLIIGDARLYSKEEQTRLNKLPALMFGNITHPSIIKLFELFDKIGVKTRIYKHNRGNRKAKSLLSLQPLPAATASPEAEKMLVQALSGKETMHGDSNQNLFSAVIVAAYQIAREAASFDVLQSIQPQIETIQTSVGSLIRKIEEIDTSLNAVNQGEVYNELIRLDRSIKESRDPHETDNIIARKSEQMEVLNKLQTIELERGRLISSVLHIQAAMIALAQRIPDLKQKASATEFETFYKQALEELDAELPDWS